MCQRKKIPLSITPKGKVLKQAVRVITTFRLVLFWLSGELPQRSKQKLFVKEDTFCQNKEARKPSLIQIDPFFRLVQQRGNLFDGDILRIHKTLLGFPLPPLFILQVEHSSTNTQTKFIRTPEYNN
jgi:hypothetical protein